MIIMKDDYKEALVREIRNYVVENLSLSSLSDDELQAKLRVFLTIFSDSYVSIEDKVQIVDQVFSSIRGFGILDTIMSDDSITEVMINGHENIFIEQNGCVKKLDKNLNQKEDWKI